MILQTSVTQRISDIMSTKLETIGKYESAKDAAKKMLDKNISSLVVIDEDGQSIGIVYWARYHKGSVYSWFPK